MVARPIFLDNLINPRSSNLQSFKPDCQVSQPRFTCNRKTFVAMPEVESSNPDYRLPTVVTPSHYDLKVYTDLERLKFEGNVDIQ